MTGSSDNEKKGQRDSRASLLRTLTNGWTGGSAAGSGSDDRGAKSDASAARDMLITLITRAGKGKDEVIQLLGREIGAALVALLKQPVGELFRDQRLQITLELVPKGKKEPQKKSSRKPTKNRPAPARK